MARLFMGKLDECMLDSAPYQPWIWWHYINDIFFIWTSDEERLSNSLQNTQPQRPISLMSSFVRRKMAYWSICQTTDLFVKPTDKHQYLHSTSCHPRHCKTSIAYSQALRQWHICSNYSDFLRHSQVLKKHLVSRGHSSRAVHQAIKKVKSMPRLSVLSEKPTTRDYANKKIPLVVTCHPSLPPICQITSANHHILHTSDRLQCAIPEKPMITFRCPPSLRDLLVRAEVPPTNDSSIPPIQHGMFRCTSRCVTCQELSWSRTPSRVTPLVPTTRSRATLPVLLPTFIWYLAGYVVFSVSVRLRTHLRNVSMVTDLQ